MKILIGRVLQMGALILLPVGLMYGLARNDIRTEVRLLAVGGAAFVIGWLLTREAQ